MALILTVGDWRSKHQYLDRLLEAGYLLGASGRTAVYSHPEGNMNADGVVGALKEQGDVADGCRGWPGIAETAWTLPWRHTGSERQHRCR